MANNYQAYMQSRGVPQMTSSPQFTGQNIQTNQTQTFAQPNYESAMQQFVPSFGFREVDGLNGVNRYPVAPGNSVALKDANSMTLYVKSVDLSGALLPLRVFQLNEITQEYLDRETPVSRAEFNQMNNTLNSLSNSIDSLKQFMEELTAPSPTSHEQGGNS